MKDLKIFDKSGKALHIADVISRFIKLKEIEHNKNNLFIAVVGNTLHIGNFTEHSMEAVENIVVRNGI